jgi:hypothetical protein
MRSAGRSRGGRVRMGLARIGDSRRAGAVGANAPGPCKVTWEDTECFD